MLDALRSELEKHREPNGFDKILEESYRKDYKIKAFDSENGDLEVDRYLNGSKKCFDEDQKELQKIAKKNGITLQ